MTLTKRRHSIYLLNVSMCRAIRSWRKKFMISNRWSIIYSAIRQRCEDRCQVETPMRRAIIQMVHGHWTIKRVLQNEKAMEFINPFSTNAPEMTRYDIMNRSIGFTNDHSGWTDTFYLDSLNEHSNEIAFRMYYEGMPLFDTEGYTMIQQTWRDNRIYQFERPLFYTSTNFQSEEQESGPFRSIRLSIFPAALRSVLTRIHFWYADRVWSKHNKRCIQCDVFKTELAY